MNIPQSIHFLTGIRTLCTAASLLLQSGLALAAAQMEDGQDYAAATSTPVAGRSPWLLASSGGAAAASTAAIGIYPGDLTGTTKTLLGGLTNSINPEAHLQIAKAGSSSRTYYRSIGFLQTNNSLYFSFLMNVSANPTSNDEIVCELDPAVASGSFPANPSANDPLTLHSQKGLDGSHYYLGIQSLAGTVNWASTNLAVSTDYLVVLEYSFGTGQPCQLFINPVPGAAQPAASATATKGMVGEPANLGTILFWESSTFTTLTASYDVMRVDPYWANVIPTNNSGTLTNIPPLTINAPAMRLLFLGDSLLGISPSYSNNIPAILMNLAQSFGDSVTNTRIANSSWYLYQFAADPTATNAINTGNYDLVILQDQTQEPSLPSTRNSSMFTACRTLNSLITNHNERTMFYETWGYINGDTSGNCANYDFPAQYKSPCDGGLDSFLNMNIALREGYAMIASQLSAAISPIGLAWATVRKTQPSLNLYILNDSLGDRHPNDYGAYLAACVFYSSIFGRSPEGCSYHSDIDTASATMLQQIAAQSVLQDPFAADPYNLGTNHYYWAYNWQNYTNPADSPTNAIVISGASGKPSPSVKVNTNVGTVSNLWLGTFDTNYNLAGQGRLFFTTGGALSITGGMIVGKEGKGFVQHNGGTLTVNGALTLAQQTNSTGQYIMSNGTLYAAQILSGDGSSAFIFQGGQLGFAQFGSLAQPLNLTSAGGTLALTNTTGTSLIYGNFSNATSATISIQLGSSLDVLAVSGTASLAGTLNLNFAPGFQPVPGQQITLLSASNLSGNFTTSLTTVVGSNGLGLVTSMTSTSVVATVANFIPQLLIPLITNANFRCQASGVAGSRYVVQACTNLSGGNWTSLATNISPFTFQETIATPQRFYRAIYMP
ncbi:MAG: DUF4886 domain-containing protein [Verrucomicrobiota bacterium]